MCVVGGNPLFLKYSSFYPPPTHPLKVGDETTLMDEQFIDNILAMFLSWQPQIVRLKSAKKS